MDMTTFIKAVSESSLSFVYSREKLNSEECKKALNNIKPEGNVYAIIFSSVEYALNGLVITEKGIWFSLDDGTVNTLFPKKKGAFLFNDFLFHEAKIKNTLTGKYKCEFIFWEIKLRRAELCGIEDFNLKGFTIAGEQIPPDRVKSYHKYDFRIKRIIFFWSRNLYPASNHCFYQFLGSKNVNNSF